MGLPVSELGWLLAVGLLAVTETPLHTTETYQCANCRVRPISSLCTGTRSPHRIQIYGSRKSDSQT